MTPLEYWNSKNLMAEKEREEIIGKERAREDAANKKTNYNDILDSTSV